MQSFINAFVDFSLGNRRKVEYKKILINKREDLGEAEIDKIINIIDTFNNVKKEKIAIHWICNGRLILPEDMGKLNDAVEISNRFGVDLFKFDGPVEAINSIKREKKNRVILNNGNPDDYSELTLDYSKNIPFGELRVYFVQDDEAGQMAVREIMNNLLGKEEKGPWCLLYGDGKGGLDKNAYGYWKYYNSIPKRIAFLNGEIIGFSASVKNKVEWWDLEDESFKDIHLMCNEPRKISLCEYADSFMNNFKKNPYFKKIKDVVFKEFDCSEEPLFFNEKRKLIINTSSNSFKGKYKELDVTVDIEPWDTWSYIIYIGFHNNDYDERIFFVPSGYIDERQIGDVSEYFDRDGNLISRRCNGVTENWKYSMGKLYEYTKFDNNEYTSEEKYWDEDGNLVRHVINDQEVKIV